MPGEQAAPTVSVCITAYQHAPFIGQCLESVLSQSFPGTLEILVGDDCSQDGTREIINTFIFRYPEQIRPFFHDCNLGPSENHYFLVNRSKGLFIAHLDGDDFWLPGKLNAQLSMLHEFPKLAAVYSNAYVIDSRNSKLGIFNSNVPSVISMHELLKRGNFLNHSSLLYRSSALDALLGMNCPYIDYRIHIRLLKHGKLGYINTPLVGYRWRTKSSVIRSMPKAIQDGYMDVFREMVSAGAEQHDIQSAISKFWGKLVVQALITKEWGYLNEWRHRLLEEPLIKYSSSVLASATIMAIPQAIASFWRRNITNSKDAVYFP